MMAMRLGRFSGRTVQVGYRQHKARTPISGSLERRRRVPGFRMTKESLTVSAG
jgi:hypothetical protein